LANAQNSLAKPFSDNSLILPDLDKIPQNILQGKEGKNNQKKNQLLSDTAPPGNLLLTLYIK